MCSSTSYRDSNSNPDKDNQSCISIEEDLNSGSDILSHFPEYQHRAVTNVLEEMKWMLRDEIALALTKVMPLSYQTLDFVKIHIQSSVEQSLEKFKENFHKMELHGIILQKENDFYYLDMSEVSKKRSNRETRNVADMAVHDDKEYFPNFLKLRFEMFVWLITLTRIFYTLPVFQLVYYYQESATMSGNLDTCYYNYFSNIAYVNGVFFILIVRIRSYKYQESCSNSHINLHFVGIPESYGLFYALGDAMAIQGILSECYHVCPTAENFQFDTTFMYVIAPLVFIKVHQF